ncbi:NAD(P)/FAD-dependent oxidoreductase [Nocardia sp. BSTN01]|uniref:flavin-containing monooxygenase n=1 Tax=Nocardia sp. BSTN01 TaxID=2783665 RepID=UPI00188DF045|nr:NAD(P)/FAD-dependent oxidoreductase [Nocardia sp. BSTN01]MBF4999651.1 NAD(P)/FAD-dependent oxidoreductase [Nocardia sp. BSTN01]
MFRKAPSTEPDPVIAVIGAGFAGIGAAVRLRRAGFHRVTLLDRADGPGGTWWHNTYEGAEVDTPSILYSYSWMPWNWSRTHVRQAELQAYLSAVLDAFDLRERCRFGVEVDRVEWDDDAREYSIRSGGREILRARYVVSAVGLLSDPKLPDLPGMDSFEGPLFHSSQWDPTVDFTGKRVAVVGSGSTATQLVPALADKAKQVTMFSREPNWIVPKRARAYTERERRALDSRHAQRLVRAMMIYQRDRAQFGGALWRPGSRQNQAAEAVARAYLERSLSDRPELLAAVTPRHPYGGKRPVISDDFYDALRADNVRLVPHGVREVTENGVVDATGDTHECDVLIMSTGFKADFLSTVNVVGRGGREIHDYWNGDERAFLGTMVPHFPNFFIMYGPNTNGGTIVTNLELQASFLTSAISRVERAKAAEIEVREWAAELYDKLIQRMLQGTAFQYEHNYYRSGSGRVATQWPDGVLLYAALTKLLRGPLLRVVSGTPRVGETAPTADGREREEISA